MLAETSVGVAATVSTQWSHFVAKVSMKMVQTITEEVTANAYKRSKDPSEEANTNFRSSRREIVFRVNTWVWRYAGNGIEISSRNWSCLAIMHYATYDATEVWKDYAKDREDHNGETPNTQQSSSEHGRVRAGAFVYGVES